MSKKINRRTKYWHKLQEYINTHDIDSDLSYRNTADVIKAEYKRLKSLKPFRINPKKKQIFDLLKREEQLIKYILEKYYSTIKFENANNYKLYKHLKDIFKSKGLKLKLKELNNFLRSERLKMKWFIISRINYYYPRRVNKSTNIKRLTKLYNRINKKLELIRYINKYSPDKRVYIDTKMKKLLEIYNKIEERRGKNTKNYNVKFYFEWDVMNEVDPRKTDKWIVVSSPTENIQFPTELTADDLKSSNDDESKRYLAKYIQDTFNIDEYFYGFHVKNIKILKQEPLPDGKYEDVLAYRDKSKTFTRIQNSLVITKQSQNTNGMCGFEMLNINLNIPIEKLEELLNRNRYDGLSPNMILELAEKLNFSFYCADATMAKIVRYKSNQNKDNNYRLRAVICIFLDEHFYDIEDKAVRQIIINNSHTARNYIETKIDRRKQTNNEFVYQTKFKLIKEKDKIIYVRQDNIHKEWIDIINKENLIPPAKIASCKVTTFEYDENIYIAMKGAKAYKEIALKHNINHTTQHLPKLSREIFDNYSNFWHESEYNEITSQLIESIYFKSGPYNKHFDAPNPKYNVYGMDIEKCYTNSAHDTLYLRITDFPVEYKGEDITYGFYYVETEEQLPFAHGSNYYDYRLVERALEDNVITKDNIKYYLSATENGGGLTMFINDVYRKHPKFGKRLTNFLIGSFLCKTESLHEKTIYTTSLHDINYYYLLYNNGSIDAIDGVDNIDLWRLRFSNKITRLTNNIITHKCITDIANLKVYELKKYIEKTNKILKIKTDCIYFEHKPKTKKPEVYKGCRYQTVSKKEKFVKALDEEFIIKKKTTKSKYKITKPEYNIINWDEQIENILKLKTCLITGPAGTGKTYIIKKLKEKLGDTCITASYTNKCSKNIDGITLHELFGIRESKQVVKRKSKITDNIKTIIIDECSMIPLSMYKYLCSLQNQENPINIYLFGDFNQIPPIDNSKFSKSSVEYEPFFIDLMKNRIILTTQHRADASYAYDCLAYYNGEKKIEDIVRVEENFIPTNINICYTNKMRKQINKLYNLKKGKKLKSELKEYGQDFYIYENLPLISYKTFYNKNLSLNNLAGSGVSLKICNSDEFIVKKLFKKYCIILDKQTNKEIEILYKTIQKNMTLAYAITNFKAQGSNINENYTIYEFDKMNRKNQYTSITRAKKREYVIIRGN